MVDGTENTPSNYYSQKVHEVQKYLTLTNHGYIGYAVIGEQEILGRPAARHPPGAARKRDMRDATTYANSDRTAREERRSDRKMKASGEIEIVTLTSKEMEAWRKALAPVQEGNAAPRVGVEVVEAIQKEAAAQGFK